MYEYYRERFFDYITGESVYIEGVNMDRAAEFSFFSKKFKQNLKQYKQAIKNRDLDMAEACFRRGCILLENFDREVSAIEYGQNGADALLGTAAGCMTTAYAGVMAGSFGSLGGIGLNVKNPEKSRNIAAAVTIIGKTLMDIRNIRESIKVKKSNGGKISAAEFNTMRAKVLHNFRKLLKEFNKIGREYKKLLEESAAENNNKSKDKKS